jgi:hypothetical protein
MRRRLGVEPAPSPIGCATEKHYTVAKIAEMWSMSVYSVRRLFTDVPGVLKIGEERKTLYIPTSIVERVHQDLAA